MVDLGICSEFGARCNVPGPSPPIPRVGRPFVKSGFIGAIRDKPFVLPLAREPLSDNMLEFLSRTVDSRGNPGLPCISAQDENGKNSAIPAGARPLRLLTPTPVAVSQTDSEDAQSE